MESPEVAAVIERHRTEQRKIPHDELSDRLFLSMLLEATRVLEEGIVATAQDVDLALIFGTGFPPFRGGLCFWADQIGADKLLERLAQYESVGRRFQPTAMLREAASQGKTLYEIASQ